MAVLIMDLLSASTTGIIVLLLGYACRSVRWIDIIVGLLLVAGIAFNRVEGFAISLIVAAAFATVGDLQEEGRWKKTRALLNALSILALVLFLLVIHKRGHSSWLMGTDGFGLLEEQGIFKAVLSTTRGIPDTIVLSCLVLAACAAWFLNGVAAVAFDEERKPAPFTLLACAAPVVLLRVYPLLDAGPRGYGGVSTQLLLLAGGGILGAFLLLSIMPYAPRKSLSTALALGLICWAFVIMPFASGSLVLSLIASAAAWRWVWLGKAEAICAPGD